MTAMADIVAIRPADLLIDPANEPNTAPLPNGSNGRDSQGRFAPGNPGGPGNPHARHVGCLRSALLSSVTEEDMRAIAKQLTEKVKSGDLRAIKELFNRTLGRPTSPRLRRHATG